MLSHTALFFLPANFRVQIQIYNTISNTQIPLRGIYHVFHNIYPVGVSCQALLLIFFITCLSIIIFYHTQSLIIRSLSCHAFSKHLIFTFSIKKLCLLTFQLVFIRHLLVFHSPFNAPLQIINIFRILAHFLSVCVRNLCNIGRIALRHFHNNIKCFLVCII